MRITLGLVVVIIVATMARNIPLKEKPKLESVTAKHGEAAQIMCTEEKESLFCMFAEPSKDTFTNIDPETMPLFTKKGKPLIAIQGANGCGIVIPEIGKTHEGVWRCQVLVRGKDPKGEDIKWMNSDWRKIEKSIEVKVTDDVDEQQPEMIILPVHQLNKWPHYLLSITAIIIVTLVIIIDIFTYFFLTYIKQ